MEKSYNLIVARYNESLDWVNVFDKFQIYNKGEKNLSPFHQKNAIQLPNVGREAHTYLYHIINNYHNLEDILIFCQGSIAGHTYFNDPREFKKNALEIDEHGFSTNLCNIAGIDYGPPGTGDNSGHFTLTFHHHGKLYYSGKDGKPKDASILPYYQLGTWWEETTGEPYIRSRSVFWGATFSVKKEFILKRSLESYMKLFGTLCSHKNALEAHFCERAWFNIFNLPLDFKVDYEPPPPPPPPPPPSFSIQDLVDFHKDEDIRKSKRLKVTSRQSKVLSKEELLSILDQAGDIMFKDEATVRAYTSTLTENMRRWKEMKCPELPEKVFYSKEDLENKSSWYVKEVEHESMSVTTSGTTSGTPFEYKRWHPAFHKIEWDYHYNLVLDEFDIPQNYHLLYFFSSHYKKDGNKMISCFGCPSELAMNNHGSSRTPIVHYVNFDMYSSNPGAFFRHLFQYIEDHPIDVVFTSSPQINSLCSHIRRYGFKGKIANLLSSTNDRMLHQDAKFLMIDNNYFPDICDHMRCWDGGASFFTCKYRNYHLMDNISYAEEIDGRFICTDYFNLASPFYKYWNGDYCSISDKYERCECGRLYREFEFLESRPFSLKGMCLTEIKNHIKSTGIPDIRQVRCSVDFLDVVSTRALKDEEKQQISAVTDKFRFRFFVEENYEN